MDIATKYADDVCEGRLVTCKWTRLACERYFNDIKHGKERGLWFDKEAAGHRINFYKYCRHFEGEFAGKIIEPSPFQVFAQWNIFGWKKEDGYRRFTTAYNSEARKQGKSTDTATTGLYLAFFDEYEGAQVYTGATKLDQARIIHHASTAMVNKSEKLKSKISVYKNILSRPDRNQIYIPLGKDSQTQDGFNPHGALIDEYHAHPDDGILNVLRSGMMTQTQSLTYIITTAGFEITYPCYEYEQHIKRILDGTEEDDSLFGIIYTLDEGDDWTEKDKWIKANPNLGVNVRMDKLEEAFKEAQALPSKQNNFKTKNLNIWTEAKAIWITNEIWQLNNNPFDEKELIGRPCYGGLDLSTTTDITAWVLCFPPIGQEEKFKFLFRFWIPENDLQERIAREHFDYRTMIQRGFIIPTPGNQVDYEFVQNQILQDAKTYQLKELAFDPYNATSIINTIQKELGKDICIEFSQGWRQMSPAAKDFERKVLGYKLATNGNPVMKWMISCCEIKNDPNANIALVKPIRGRTGKHIDGVVASVMALSRAVMEIENKSVYEERGLRMI